MAVYFDTKVNTVQPGVNTGLYFHQVNPLLVVTTYDNAAGGAVSLYNKDVSRIRLFVCGALIAVSAPHYNDNKDIVKLLKNGKNIVLSICLCRMPFVDLVLFWCTN